MAAASTAMHSSSHPAHRLPPPVAAPVVVVEVGYALGAKLARRSHHEW